MKIYDFKSEQNIPISLEDAWNFFSSPKNLKVITPDNLGFKITSDLNTNDGKMYPGQIITYIVKPLAGIPVRWATEITHVEKHKYFVDEQRFGPYAMWHHQHFFEEIEGGVLMKDIINYAIPLGPIGRMANTLIVRSKLKEIFDYRSEKIIELFGKL